MPSIALHVEEPWDEYAARFLADTEAGGKAALPRPHFTDPPQPPRDHLGRQAVPGCQ
jgi:hypothetical protein